MHQSVGSTRGRTAIAFARLAAAVDAWSSVIAGFALLGGARAFMFIALLGWREPVLGGAGLVLLATLGWVRWWCGGSAEAAAAAWHTASVDRPDESHGCVDVMPRSKEARQLLATIDRSNAMRAPCVRRGTSQLQGGRP